MSIDAATATVLGAAVGAAVAGVFTVFNLWLARRSDERRQIRELAVRAAIENWKYYDEAAKQLGQESPPLDIYILHASRLVSAIDGRELTPVEIRSRIRSALEAADAARIEIDEYNERQKRGQV